MFYYIFVHLLKDSTKMEPDITRIDNKTLHDVLNKSSEVDPKLYDRYLMNKAIDEPAYTILIIMYCLLILMGALGNTLVVSFDLLRSTMILVIFILIFWGLNCLRCFLKFLVGL